MAYCELCDMDLEFCGHNLVERHTNAAAAARQLLISRTAWPTSQGVCIKMTIQATVAGRRLTHGNLATLTPTDVLMAAEGCVGGQLNPSTRTKKAAQSWSLISGSESPAGRPQGPPNSLRQ